MREVKEEKDSKNICTAAVDEDRQTTSIALLTTTWRAKSDLPDLSKSEKRERETAEKMSPYITVR